MHHILKDIYYNTKPKKVWKGYEKGSLQYAFTLNWKFNKFKDLQIYGTKQHFTPCCMNTSQHHLSNHNQSNISQKQSLQVSRLIHFNVLKHGPPIIGQVVCDNKLYYERSSLVNLHVKKGVQ
jgi:hypothetical protein